MRSYTFRVFLNETAHGETHHRELGAYENLESPPWIPPVGSFFRFRDPYPPNKAYDHVEKKGRVKDIVTCFYGTRTVIEVYLDPC